jgi:hypothetical protein
MAVAGERMAITTARSVISLAGGSRGQKLYIQNTSAAVIYLGGSDVTTSVYGWALPATSGSLTVELEYGEVLYAIAASSVSLNVLRIGV